MQKFITKVKFYIVIVLVAVIVDDDEKEFSVDDWLILSRLTNPEKKRNYTRGEETQRQVSKAILSLKLSVLDEREKPQRAAASSCVNFIQVQLPSWSPKKKFNYLNLRLPTFFIPSNLDKCSPID